MHFFRLGPTQTATRDHLSSPADRRERKNSSHLAEVLAHPHVPTFSNPLKSLMFDPGMRIAP